jgi:arginyl-tRNA synthetase
VHILSEEDEALRNSRLLLCQKVAEFLEQGLALLGISVPQKMYGIS